MATSTKFCRSNEFLWSRLRGETPARGRALADATEQQGLIQSNLQTVRQRIAEAAQRSGRSDSDVTLVAITKYIDAEITRLLFLSGGKILGESRPQELWHKAEQLSDLPITWHLVGHLQRNKVQRTLRYAQMIHSVDSERLATALNSAASQRGQPLDVLLEINVSGESAKHGFSAQSLAEAFDLLCQHDHLRIRGLMCMAAMDADDETTRREFAELRQLRDQLAPRARYPDQFSELSMGMSGDYEIAIEEGATIVRIGSALYEGIL